MRYENITIYCDKDKKFQKAVIKTNYGNLEVKNHKEFDNLLNDYARISRMTVNDLYKVKGFIKIVVPIEETKKEEPKKDERRKTGTKTYDLSDEELDAILGDLDDDDKKKSKKKKGSFVKRLIAGAAVIAVLGTGAYHLDKHKGVFKGRVYAFFHPDKKVEFMLDNNNAPGDNSYSGSSSSSNNGSTSQTPSDYDQTMTGVMNREESNRQVIHQLAENGTVDELSGDQLLSTLNDHTRYANASIFEVSQFINNRGLSGTAYYYNFEELFNDGSADYHAVKMFSTMRNDIIREAFSNKNVGGAKAKIESFYNLFTEFVIVGGPHKFTYNNQEYVINFNDLSDMAKTTILEIGSAMFTIDLDYSYNNDGYRYNKEEILDDSVSMLEGELIPRLISRGYHK